MMVMVTDWLTISSTDGKPGNTDISVYDSMYPSVGSYTKKQIAAIVCSKENTITLNMKSFCSCKLEALTVGCLLLLSQLL